jgi:Domain of unknown function (DUF5666)
MKTVVVALVVVVAVLGGFYGGYRVGQSNATAATSSGSGTGRTGGNGFTRGGGALANACPSPGSSPAATGSQAVARGQITSISATAMTINTGSCSVTIDFATGTVVIKQVTASTSDLQDSQMVTVVGTRQADGSVKAATIAIGGGIITGGGGAGG